MSKKFINCKNHKLDLSNPIVMGILNVTPDSFSDGGKFNNISNAMSQVEKMVLEGADIIDIGGESAKPGAKVVSEAEELERVIPVIESISQNFDIPISIDTSNPIVMKEAVNSGASLINDVRALQKEGALNVAASLDVPVCLMHMQNNPQTMQINPNYSDVIDDVKSFLMGRVNNCINAGILKENIIIDPGFGFGKNLGHNLRLLNELSLIAEPGYPLLVGLSRKSMIGQVLDLDVDKRLYGTISANLIAFLNGGNIFRVHDVAAAVQSLKFAKRAISE